MAAVVVVVVVVVVRTCNRPSSFVAGNRDACPPQAAAVSLGPSRFQTKVKDSTRFPSPSFNFKSQIFVTVSR